MRRRDRRARYLASCVGNSGLVLLTWIALTACESRAGQIEAAQRRTGALDRVPTSEVGGGVDPTSGLPIGYPPSLPLVPGWRAMSGGVDPGVVRTSTLVYDGRSVAEVEQALRAALEERNARVVNVFTPRDGSTQLRIDLGDGYATVILSDDHGRVRFDTTAIDRRRREH